MYKAKGERPKNRFPAPEITQTPPVMHFYYFFVVEVVEFYYFFFSNRFLLLFSTTFFEVEYFWQDLGADFS